MRNLFVASGISFIFTMFDCYCHFFLDFWLQLNAKQIQCVDAVIVKPRLSDIKINDSLSEIFENELDIGCMLLDKQLLLFINFDL